MPSYEPEEDADALDDDALLERYLGGTSTKAEASRSLPEWPPLTSRDVALTLDAQTVSWFRANHADWRRQMAFVLRAWVVAHTKSTINAAADTIVSGPAACSADQPLS